MLTKIWTGALLFLAWMFFCAWLVLVCHEKNVHPLRDFCRFFKKQSTAGGVLLGTFFIVLWIYASVKPGDGGGNGGGGGDGSTNNIQMVIGPGGVLQPKSLPNAVTNNLQQGLQGGILPPQGGMLGDPDPITDQWADFTPIASTNTTRTLTAADFARGFVLTRVGTGEAFGFAAPVGANVCADWRAFGAATDWIYLAFEDWAFQLGTNEVDRLRVFSFGKVDPLVRGADGRIATGNWFAPFMASLGVVPQANWPLVAGNENAATPEALAPSQFWHFVTPSNTLQLTWQNVLLNRDTDTPLSFQIEFKLDGQFIYRYDFSRLNTESVSNIFVGASYSGHAWVTNSLPTNITSMAFCPLSQEDVYNQDPDNDGLSTIDELFFYNTDPRNPDTDNDGLTDYDEIVVHGLDPLDPYSNGGLYSDGFSLTLGDLDPFSFPEGSTNSVLEHVFYSGTTNGVFSYPQSSDNMAVLLVSVSGSGTGDLIVGGKVVPLIAPPAPQQTPQNLPGNTPRLMGAAPASAHPPLLVQLVKGETYPLYIRGDELLEVALYSADFAFGVLPTHNSFGRINFPNTVAAAPCIHDFNARKKIVSLPASKDAHQLTAEWSSASDSVTVSNIPPRSTSITGNFPARQTKGISYTLSHPEYLFGQTTYQQTVRFCPRPHDPDPEDPDEPDTPEDPEWFDHGDGDSSDGSEEHEEHWYCYWGTCDEWCGCGCDCAGSGDGENIPDDTEDFDEECPEHHLPYEDCAHWHEDDYTNAVQSVQHLAGVMYIREPSFYEQIHLDVPTEHRNCCPCPDHWTNYVGVAYKSYRLRLIDANGADFEKTETSCDVNLAGVYPSSAVGDATLAFSRNGEVYLEYAKTVLGVAIKGGSGVNLGNYNALNSSFGYPMTVCTNLWSAPEMRLVTNVRLPDGKVHLELANVTGQFTVWYYDRTRWEYRKLLDTTTAPVKDLPMNYWKALMKRAGYENSAELPIYITSSASGAVSLVFRYWNVIDGRFVQDQVVQRITSIRPPLRLDISRDGSIDDGDSAAWFDGRSFHYWINEDTIYGDYIIPNTEYSTRNSSDLVVNGSFDLINFFPVALDLEKFKAAWGNRVSYEVKPEWGNTNSFNFCLADVPWNVAGSMQTTNTTTLSGQPLSSASLVELPAGGVELPYSAISQFSENSGLMVCEAKSSYASMRIDIKFNGELLYSYSVPMTILPVKQMYSWVNSRYLSGDNVARATAVHRIWDEHNTKSLIFLHGANVNESQAESWGDILFKRMWVSGIHADFYNVDWRSNIGEAYDYHGNASNAFVVASQLAPILSNIPGEKIIMAHSLGNMVVSSMIQDYGLQVSKYIMCNSAVPAEAYDTTLSPTNVLVHKDWNEYPRKSFANEWYKCFEDDVGDDRYELTWCGRFSDVAAKAVNFYSTGDHVLELYDNNNVWTTDGYENWNQMFERYSWHKQELWKGRKGLFFNMGTTDWAGWSIRENLLGYNAIQPTNAWLMSSAELKTNTVFKLQPESMNTNSIPLLLRGAHLAKGIPARTPASGATKWGPLNMNRRMVNLESTDEDANGLQRPNGWVARSNGWFSDWGDRWLHSDIKDVAYFFVFKFYQRLKEEGALQ